MQWTETSLLSTSCHAEVSRCVRSLIEQLSRWHGRLGLAAKLVLAGGGCRGLIGPIASRTHTQSTSVGSRRARRSGGLRIAAAAKSDLQVTAVRATSRAATLQVRARGYSKGAGSWTASVACSRFTQVLDAGGSWLVASLYEAGIKNVISI